MRYIIILVFFYSLLSFAGTIQSVMQQKGQPNLLVDGPRGNKLYIYIVQIQPPHSFLFNLCHCPP